MGLSRLIPMLETDDLQGTMIWYRDILGFQVTGLAPDSINPYWISLKRDSVEVMFTDRNEHSPHPKPVMTGVLYCYPEDVESLWLELKDKVKVEWPLQVFNYGMKEFAIRDPNDYLLSFGQTME